MSLIFHLTALYISPICVLHSNVVCLYRDENSNWVCRSVLITLNILLAGYKMERIFVFLNSNMNDCFNAVGRSI